MKNVTKKLLKAIETVGGEVPKTGWNNFSKYKYITESDVNKVVLPALLKQGLLLTTSLESVTESPSGPDSKNRFATVHLIHSVIDVESGESLTLKSAGTAADTLDKAIYKAYTGSCKYFMMKLFLISGDDSDPENDGVDKPVQSESKSTSSFPKAATTKVDTKNEPKVETKPEVKKTETKKPNFSNSKPSFGQTSSVKKETLPNGVDNSEVQF